LRAGDRKTARKFAIAANTRYDEDTDWPASDLAVLIEVLVGVDESDEAISIAKGREELDDQATVLLEIAEAKLKFGDATGAKKALDEIPVDFEFDDDWIAFRYVDVLTKVDDTAKAIELLKHIESKVLDDPLNVDRTRLLLIRRYFDLGNEKEARAIWDSVSDRDDIATRLSYSEILVTNGKSSNALRMLDALDLKDLGDDSSSGFRAAKAYLTLGKTSQALRVAKAISDDIDNYEQQAALMVVADQYIKEKNNKAARDILDFAFQRATKIVFAHEPEQSRGASPGTRKEQYLTEISKRYVEIGDLDTALKVLIAIDADHPMAKDDLAINLARFAQTNAKKLPRAKFESLMARALKMTDEEKLDYIGSEVRVLYAEGLAEIGEREEAVDLIADLIQKFADHESDADTLLSSGEIFEKYHLPVTEHLRKSLMAVLAAHE
jgi:tetratricopeptide (TPR) repeat protein